MSKLFYRYEQKEKNELTLALHLEIMPWQEFQFVVRTMLWEEMPVGGSDEELGEIEDNIRQIRGLLCEDDVTIEFRDTI